MIAILFALGSALSYGVADFLGGFFSKRTSVWALTFVVQLVGCVFILAVTIVNPGDPTREDFLWAGFGGIANGVGTAALYRGLASGSMSVVAPDLRRWRRPRSGGDCLRDGRAAASTRLDGRLCGPPRYLARCERA